MSGRQRKIYIGESSVYPIFFIFVRKSGVNTLEVKYDPKGRKLICHEENVGYLSWYISIAIKLMFPVRKKCGQLLSKEF